MSTGRCGECPHAAHRGSCRAKGPSRCVPLPGGGFACGSRPPCPCPLRVCKCGMAVAVAILDADPGMEVPVICGSAGAPEGLLEVWRSPDGVLTCRELTRGEQVAGGRWRGTEHDGPCQPVHGPAYQAS